MRSSNGGRAASGTYTYEPSLSTPDNHQPVGSAKYTAGPTALIDVYTPDENTTGTLVVDGAHHIAASDTPGDSDWFAVTLTAGGTYQFGQYAYAGGIPGAEGNGTPLADAYLEIYDSAGNLLSIANGGGPNTPSGLDALMTFEAPYSGTFYVNATSYDNNGDGVGDFAGDYEIFAITAPPNTAPVIDLDADDSNVVGTGFASAYTEGGAAAAVGDTDVQITDADAGDNVESVTVTITNPETGDVLTVVGALPAGLTLDPGSTATNVVITGTGTAANYQTAVEQITFSNSGDNPTDGGTNTSRSITVVVNDGDADSNVATATVTVADDNADAPAGTSSTITVSEDAFRLLTSVDLGFSDVDGIFAGVTISGVSGGGIYYDADGAGGGEPVLQLLPKTYTAQDLIDGKVSIKANANVNGSGIVTITFAVIDDDGNTDASSNTLTVDVTAINDAPVLTTGGPVAATEQSAVAILPAGSVADIDLDARNGGNGDYAGASFSVNRNPATNAEDVFTLVAGPNFTIDGSNLKAGGMVFGTVSVDGSTGLIVINFTSLETPATSALVDEVIQAVHYTNTSDNPPASVGLAVGFDDGSPGGGQGAGATDLDVNLITVNVAGVNDAAVAADDALTAGEDSIATGNVFSNNGSGADSDPDGPALVITHVQGGAVNVGNQITLPSGARLTLNANGTFSYDPNGAFDELPGPGSGASNASALDNFTYTLAGGDTATVTITINGVDSDDAVVGTATADTLSGGVGNDTLSGLAGNDILNGGDGIDTASYSTAGSGVAVDLRNAGAQNTGGGGTDTLSGIENLTGSAFADTLHGNGANNVLSGLAGDDVLTGGDGADTLVGGLGNDRYAGVTAGDVIVEVAGEGGSDWVQAATSYTLAAGVSVETLNTVNASATSAINLTGNEFGQAIYGNGGSNVLTGLGGDDILVGGDGTDTLVGGLGNDRYSSVTSADVIVEVAGEGGSDWVQVATSYTLAAGVSVETMTTVNASATSALNLTGNEFNQAIYGNAGANVLSAAAGNDTLVGLGGNDTLVGGAGLDSMRGGVGNDSFVFNAAADSATAAPDRILDLAAGDTIDLAGIDANSGQIGDQAFSFIGTGAFTNTAGELRYQQVNGNTLVYGDTNGDGAADFAISLDGTHALTVDYFVV